LPKAILSDQLLLKQMRQLQQLKVQQVLSRLHRAPEIIHSLQVAQSHVHRAPEIIHSQLVAQFRVHLPDQLVQQVRHDLACQVLVQVQFVQVLQPDQIHHVQQVLALEISHHVLLAVQLLPDHIVLTVHLELVHQQLVLQRVQVAVVHHNVAVPVVHSEKMRARVLSESQRAEKRCAMSSTICKHQNLVALLFRTVMDQLQYVCAAVHLWLTLPTKLEQIQQR
jgi:hypothetical protein